MVYQYDQALQLPTVDLYDTQMMAMALQAAKDMYDKGEQQIKDFQKNYGDFLTPITADQNWWNQNVTGRVRDAINQMYARGGDPLRNAQDRAQISMLINNMPYGDMAKVRSSAKNAEAYLEARRKLEAEGKYNQAMSKYDGPDMSTYNTVNDGIWDKMSPTPFENVAIFGNPYFEGMKPTVHKQSKNGIEYAVEEINMDDLRRIADAHHNELVSTPQGQMMYKYYQDVARQNGSIDVEGDARRMFNDAIADGQRRRMYKVDNYNDNYFKFKELENARAGLALRQKQLELQQQRNNILANKAGYGRSSSGSGDSSNKELVSYYEPLYQNLVVNTLNKDPMRSTVFNNKEFTMNMGNSILGAQRNIANQYFSVSGKNDIYGGRVTSSNQAKGFGGRIDLLGGIQSIQPNYYVDSNISSTKEFMNSFNKNYRSYLNQFTIGDYTGGFSSMFANTWKQGSAKIDDLTYQGKSVDKVKGQNYVAFGLSDINLVYSAEELAARMAGITGPVLEKAKVETQRLRDRLKNVLAADNGSVVMKATSPIGSGLRDVGQYGIFANTEFKTTGGQEITLLGDAVIATPFMSTPNPNASEDDRLNLSLDQTLDLEQQLMDNKAVRSLGVSSNTGSIDNTLPQSDPWYTLNDDFADFDWTY